MRLRKQKLSTEHKEETKRALMEVQKDGHTDTRYTLQEKNTV